MAWGWSMDAAQVLRVGDRGARNEQEGARTGIDVDRGQISEKKGQQGVRLCAQVFSFGFPWFYSFWE